MPRRKHVVSGVIVSVSDDTAARLDADWVDPEAGDTVGTGATPPERSATPDDSWKLDELKAYAEEHDVALTDARSKDKVLADITAGAPKN